jgi:tripartite-type tricarboxylate transporter receptor subunit TctC
MGVGPLGDIVALKDTGNLKVLAVASGPRSPFMPDVPTLKQLGINLAAEAPYGMWLPSRTPDDIGSGLIHMHPLMTFSGFEEPKVC